MNFEQKIEKAVELFYQDERTKKLLNWLNFELEDLRGLNNDQVYFIYKCPMFSNIVDHVVNNNPINYKLKPHIVKMSYEPNRKTPSMQFHCETKNFITSSIKVDNLKINLIDYSYLNCYSFFLNIKNKVVKYNKNFEDFFKNKQVEIKEAIQLDRPSLFIQTLIDGIVAKEQLSAYFNHEKYVQLYESLYPVNARSLDVFKYSKAHPNDCSFKLTENQLEVLQKNVSLFYKFCMVHSSPDYIVIQNIIGDPSYQKTVENNPSTNPLILLNYNKYDSALLRDEMVQKNFKQKFKYFFDRASVSNFLSFCDNVSKLPKTRFENFILFNSLGMIEMDLNDSLFLANSGQFLNESISPKYNFRLLIKFFDKHFALKKVFKELTPFYNFKDLVKIAYKIEKSNNLMLIGLLENLSAQTVTKYHEYFNKPIDELFALLIQLNPSVTKNLSTLIDLEFFEYSSYIRQLRNTLDLKKEGIIMHHCVGGYTNALSSGSFLFHLTYKKHHSTLQLVKQTDGFYKIHQHKSFGNKDVNIRLHLIAKRLEKFLNKEFKNIKTA